MNLIALGCSLMDIYGMKEYLADHTNRKLINLSHRASSNALQIKRFHEHILHNKVLTDDIIIWEITSFSRIPLRLQNTESTHAQALGVQTKHKLYGLKKHFVLSNKNLFDGDTRLDFLCHSPMITKNMYYEYDYNDSLQELLSTLILAKKFHNNLLVFFGWKDIMDQDAMVIFKKYLDSNHIDYLDDCYLDWAINKKLSMYDDTHPSANSSIEYGKTIILPKLNQLGWINNP